MTNESQTETYSTAPSNGNSTADGHAAWDATTPLDQRPLGWSIGRLLTLDEYARMRPEEQELRRQHTLDYLDHLGEDRDEEEQRETFEVLRKAFNL